MRKNEITRNKLKFNDVVIRYYLVDVGCIPSNRFASLVLPCVTCECVCVSVSMLLHGGYAVRTVTHSMHGAHAKVLTVSSVFPTSFLCFCCYCWCWLAAAVRNILNHESKQFINHSLCNAFRWQWNSIVVHANSNIIRVHSR